MSNKMWTLFEQYQPYADAQGHGESWRRMTTEQTRKSVCAAALAAWDADAADAARAAYAAEGAAAYAAASAAWAADAADAAWAATAAAHYETLAIERITRAINEAQA